MSGPLARLPVGVVIERRAIDNPWQDHVWRPVAVVPGAGPCPEWRVMRQGEGWVQYHAATMDIELYAKDTGTYHVNLNNDVPQVYVVLRPDTSGAHEVTPFLVTVNPHEAESYLTGGEGIVEGVPMPEEMMAWLQAFIDRHHVEVPFLKRQRVPHKDRQGGPPPLAVDGKKSP
ncbi:MAG: DUF3305 domain-containing protein [Rhodospirillales bacterium]|nr:DUF3305 domain-containing protein [Rhodospirillales bacterium]